VRPRRLLGASGRPLNFNVRRPGMSSSARRRLLHSITSAVLAAVVICVFGQPSHMPFGYVGVAVFSLGVVVLAMYLWDKID
jgi:peptidoglycan/LPS O-acetylase OafA/YrhL